MRITYGAIVGLLIALGPGAQAQTTSQAELAEAPGRPYDLVANCLMRQLAGRQFAVWPLVYAPPRLEALVNLWIRGREDGSPLAVFHVVQAADGITRVSYEQTPGAPAPSKATAQAAARQCLR